MADSTVFEGRTPGGSGGMVELRDGRWLMVWSGLNASYSMIGDALGQRVNIFRRARTHYRNRCPNLLGPLQSGKLGLLYGRLSGTAGGTLSG